MRWLICAAATWLDPTLHQPSLLALFNRSDQAEDWPMDRLRVFESGHGSIHNAWTGQPVSLQRSLRLEPHASVLWTIA